MTLKVDGYQEQQMRQRLVTVMNAHSDEVDVFMTLPSREGEQFAAAGWYADLSPMTKNEAAKDYDFAGLSQALLKAGTFNGKLTSMPMNIEGPILYYRTDILKKCGVEKPKTIKDVEAAAQKIKACDSTITPFVSRGLKPAVAYTFSNMLHNIGGSYMANGKSEPLLAEGQGGAGYLQPAAARLWPARRRQLQLPADIGALSQRPRRDVVRILQRTAHRDGGRRAAQGYRPGAVPGRRGRAGADRDRLGHGGVRLQQAAGCGLVLRAMGDEPGDSEAHGVAGDRAAASGGRQRSRIPQVDR